MLKAEQIPLEVQVALNKAHGFIVSPQALASAINAWPFKEYHSHHCQAFGGYGPWAIILPLPMENING